MSPEATRWPGVAGAVVVLLAALVAQLGAAWGWRAVWPGNLDLTLLAGLSNGVALTLVAALAFGWSRETPAFRRPAGAPAGFWLGLGLTAGGATIVLGEVANVTSWLVPLPPALAQVFNDLTEGSPWVSLFTLALVAPVTEEALFRGLLLRGFARRYGTVPGLVLSSALFALFHLNVWQALAAFVAGLYLGWVFLKTRSLWPSVVVHGVFNGLPVVLSALGWTVVGYNTPTVPGRTDFQPLGWVFVGVLVLGGGLWLSFRWAPPTVSARELAATGSDERPGST